MITLNEKKFSTAALALTMAIWGLMPGGQGGQAFAQATVSPGAAAPRPELGNNVFVPNAPDRYTVVKGDTLWGIAGRFLQKPWRWPEIWQMNRDQIRNPHWIYPGQVIVLDKLNGTMRLANGGEGATVRLNPNVQVDKNADAIPSIPQEAIGPFLSQPLVVDDALMSSAPRIIGTKSDRVVIGRGDVAYISGVTDPQVQSYQVFRQGTPLIDPETQKIIAYQADYLGTAKVTREGDPATIVITSFAQEINVGDRLVPTSKVALVNYAPHAPDQPIEGRVISTYGGLGFAGKNMIISMNRGTSNGLEVGHVLALQTAGRTIEDTTNGSPKTYKLPDERNGLVFVFRVFDKISYGLVMSATVPVESGDVFTQP